MQVEGKIQINNGQHCNCKCNHWGEENRKEKHTHTLFADWVKCLDRLWLQDCITELANIAMKIVIVTIVSQIAIIRVIIILIIVSKWWLI